MVYKLIPFINESSFISGSYCYKSLCRPDLPVFPWGFEATTGKFPTGGGTATFVFAAASENVRPMIYIYVQQVQNAWIDMVFYVVFYICGVVR